MLTPNASAVLQKLCEVARAGPIRAVGRGSTAVGMTLLHALGMDYTSTDKPRIMGIVVTARRSIGAGPSNRVNLFGRVPDWSISACKSSGEIVQEHGYDAGPGVRRLFCTVRARHPNSHGLALRVNLSEGTLDEFATTGSGAKDVARWSLKDLRGRLAQTHPESIWVSANASHRADAEYFHYRKAVYTGPPFAERLDVLLAEGTVTVDHLIEKRQGSTREKGPLFKIEPLNLPLLFPSSVVYDLLTFEASTT